MSNMKGQSGVSIFMTTAEKDNITGTFTLDIFRHNISIKRYFGQKTPVAQNYIFIAISFYHNIVCKNV
jgi:hypothetical protein